MPTRSIRACLPAEIRPCRKVNCRRSELPASLDFHPEATVRSRSIIIRNFHSEDRHFVKTMKCRELGGKCDHLGDRVKQKGRENRPFCSSDGQALTPASLRLQNAGHGLNGSVW
jgi:hypothetical protein